MKYFVQVAQLSKRNPAQIETWFPNSPNALTHAGSHWGEPWRCTVSGESVAHMCLLAHLSLCSSRKGLARFQFLKLLSICPACAAFPDAPALLGIQARCMGNGSSSQQTLSFFPSRLPLPTRHLGRNLSAHQTGILPLAAPWNQNQVPSGCLGLNSRAPILWSWLCMSLGLLLCMLCRRPSALACPSSHSTDLVLLS